MIGEVDKIVTPPGTKNPVLSVSQFGSFHSFVMKFARGTYPKHSHTVECTHKYRASCPARVLFHTHYAICNVSTPCRKEDAICNSANNGAGNLPAVPADNRDVCLLCTILMTSFAIGARGAC